VLEYVLLAFLLCVLEKVLLAFLLCVLEYVLLAFLLVVNTFNVNIVEMTYHSDIFICFSLKENIMTRFIDFIK
jgi:hypothetical protein